MDNFLKNLSYLHPVASTFYGQDDQENFGEMCPLSLFNIIQYVVFFTAIYLAFKCTTKTGGVDILQVILAMIFSPFYVVYRLARPCT